MFHQEDHEAHEEEKGKEEFCNDDSTLQAMQIP
jgi:hypothetical protein